MAVARPLWLQALTDYTAQEFRALIDAAFPLSKPVTGMTVGPNNPVGMSVVVAPGYAAIPAKGAGGGKYLLSVTANEVVVITPANTQPRIDLIVARIADTTFGDASDGASCAAIAGVPGASPVAPATPAGSIALATVAVAANAVNIAGAAITPAPLVGPGPILTTNMANFPTAGATGTWVDFSPANFPPLTVQVGPSGVLRIDMQAQGGNNNTANSTFYVSCRITGPTAVGQIGQPYTASMASIGTAGSSGTVKSYGGRILTGLIPGIYTITPNWYYSSGSQVGTDTTKGPNCSSAVIQATPM